MWVNKFFRTVSYKPMDAVGFVLAFAALLNGLYLLTVGLGLIDIPMATNYLLSARISGVGWLPNVFGSMQIILGTAWVGALFNKHRSWSVRVRKTCAMAMFIIYIFYGFSALILDGLTPASWLSIFAVALVAGIKYLWLATMDEKDGR